MDCPAAQTSEKSACFQKTYKFFENKRFQAAYTIQLYSSISPSSDKRSVVLRIDFPDFLQAIDIGLVDALDSSAAAVVAAGTELAVDAACAPQRLVDDLLPLLPRCVLDQYGFHFITLSENWIGSHAEIFCI